jgi:hypothetical protein
MAGTAFDDGATEKPGPCLAVNVLSDARPSNPYSRGARRDRPGLSARRPQPNSLPRTAMRAGSPSDRSFLLAEATLRGSSAGAARRPPDVGGSSRTPRGSTAAASSRARPPLSGDLRAGRDR